MHLTPEQIERQPFRMRRRGYDIVQVRAFLRDLAGQLRNGSSTTSVRQRVAAIEAGADELEAARTQAARIVEEAETRAKQRSLAVLAETQARLDDLLAEERLMRKRLAALRDALPVSADDPQESPPIAGPDEHAGERGGGTDDPEGDALASFLQSALRHEVEADRLDGSE